MVVVEREIQGRKVIIESGKMAKQANGSVLIKCGDSALLVTACAGEEKGGDFLPLTMEYVIVVLILFEIVMAFIPGMRN